MLPGLAPLVATKNAPPPEPTYLGRSGTILPSGSFNFGGYAAPDDGLMVALFLSAGDVSRTVSGVFIGGSAATVHDTGPSSTIRYAVASRQVSAGTNNVTVNLSGADSSTTATAVFVYFIADAPSDTPTDTDFASAVAGTTAVTLDLPARSVALFAAIDVSSGSVTASWSSASVDVNAAFSNRRATAAHITSTAADAGHTETITWGSGATRHLMVGGVWT